MLKSNYNESLCINTYYNTKYISRAGRKAEKAQGENTCRRAYEKNINAIYWLH